MFSVDGLDPAYTNAPTGSVNTHSSDEDMIDIQHSGTTSDVMSSANGRSMANAHDENPTNSTLSSMDDIPEAGMGQYDDFHTIGKVL